MLAFFLSHRFKKKKKIIIHELSTDGDYFLLKVNFD